MISSLVGDDTRIPKQRLFIAGKTREVELTHRISRQVATYFSIVLLSACWASFVSSSTSVITITLKKLQKVVLIIQYFLYYYDYFEVALTVCINDVSLSNLFYYICDNDTIINPCIRWIH